MINGISVVVEIIAILFCNNYMYGRKIRWNIFDALFTVLQICIVESANYLNADKKIMILSYFVIILHQLCKFRPCTKKICVNAMATACVVVILQFSCSAPFILVEKNLSINVIVLCTNLIMLFVIALLGRKGILERLSRSLLKYDWLACICTFCCFFGSFYIMILYKVEQCMRHSDHIIFGVWTILLFLLILNWQRTKEKYKMKEKELEIGRVYAGYADQLLKSVLRKQHDFDNYIQALSGQCQTASTLEELVSGQQEFISGIRKDNRYNKLLAGGNSLLVGFLYSKFTAAEQNGCDITYRVHTKDLKCSVPLCRLVEMIGILFDNAVEAVMGSENKEIFVSVTEGGKDIQVCVRNFYPYVPQDTIQGWLQEGLSTKGENRGMGLANVMRITEEYQIDFMIYNRDTADGNQIVFELRIAKP